MSVRRVDFGYFIRPPVETGTGAPRAEPCLGYLIDHADGRLLFDTGMGSNPEVDAHYRPRRQTLEAALHATGMQPGQIDLVANCHLHFDHCGGNPLLDGRPVFTQRIELEAARHTRDYTLPELIDTPQANYEELDGEAEILTGVTLFPTPGHTAGHQSLLVQLGDGTVVVAAGQSHDSATDYSADALAWRARRERHPPPLPIPSAWMDRLLKLDPARVVFAHDHAVWVP
ncbi:MAG TPA: N-acyl homoserine lactonase family protein [Candidatus Dormibacteraeota bacterium]|nr:N-acyl homoserine lactonase family protein [Candidatus Dormibacteraeota bacterium]